MILAGDIGGTKVHLAVFRAGAGALAKEGESVRVTREITALPEALREFSGRHGGNIEACVLGVAGPAGAAAIQGTNLPWPVRRDEVADALGGVPVRLLNDLEASGLGLDALEPGDLETLQAGIPVRHAPRALVSPGTGLGESLLLRAGGRTVSVGTEGGHADFAPRTDEEIDLLRHLRRIHGRVSVERVVSGPGLGNIFLWLRDSGRVEEDASIASGPGSPDAAVITRAALDGSSRICRETVRVWTEALGSEAGNVALRALPRAGLFLGGGIPARILPILRGGGFLDAFRDKDPHRELLETIPVLIVKNPETTLLGAARAAVGLAEAAGDS